jgi:hypothetical protein
MVLTSLAAQENLEALANLWHVASQFVLSSTPPKRLPINVLKAEIQHYLNFSPLEKVFGHSSFQKLLHCLCNLMTIVTGSN